jgi:hypothetical protein
MAPQRCVSHQTVRLARGKHTSPERGACVMELSSMLADEPFSDRPQSVCPIVASFLRAYNDALDDEHRQDLYRFASDCIDTRGPRALERARAARCLSAIADLADERPGLLLRVRGRQRAAMPGSDAELERMTGRLVRALRRSPGGHARALALADGLIAMRDPSVLAGARDAWALPGRRTPAATG